MKKSYLLFFLVMAILSACETDFEVNAPWKETAIVYGLLDQTADTQKVIIYKAFLGQESAYTMAQEPDSFYYAEGQLDVLLYGVNSDDDTIQTITLEYNLSNNRFSTGFDTIFSTEYSVEYVTAEPLDESLVYHLYIHNIESGYEARSKTALIEPLEINRGFTDEIKFFKNNEYRNHRLQWSSSRNGKIYRPYLRFYYYERNVTTGEVVRKFIDKSYSQMYSSNSSGGSDMELYITGESFYFFVKNTISEEINIQRINAKFLEDGFVEYDYWHGGIDFLFLVGGVDVAQYIEINNLPSLIFQDPPTFTNIENGKGVFSSRLHAQQTGKYLDVNSLIELSNGELTNQLNFLEP
ncbi:hypothetical protein N9Y90_02735 [Flavobacteriales bacterium]|nr:hypothetical protein [Flavobacteriales bacterium]